MEAYMMYGGFFGGVEKVEEELSGVSVVEEVVDVGEGSAVRRYSRAGSFGQEFFPLSGLARVTAPRFRPKFSGVFRALGHR